jgi:hypothetical protein
MVFHLWIYHTFNQLTSSIGLPHLVPPLPYYSTAFSSFIMSSSYTDALYFSIIHSVILFPLSPPPSPIK